MGGGNSVLNKARKNPDGDEADILYKTMDKDENGQLTVPEVFEAIKKKHNDWPVTAIKETVERFDVNKDGKISRAEFAEALAAMQDRPEAKQRVKPGQKPLGRMWTFKNPKPAVEKVESGPLVESDRTSLTEEDLKKAEQMLREQRAQKDRDAAAKRIADERAAAEAKAVADAAAAEDEAKAAANKAKVNAKIAEVEANMERKKQEAAAKAEAEAKATAEAEAAKQAERAKLADEWIAAEKEKMKPEQDAKKAAAAAAAAEEQDAEKERLAKIAAQTDEATALIEQQEQKAAAKEEADKRSMELRGGL